MEYQLSFSVNKKIYLRDPEGTELGKEIVKRSIDLIFKLGFEQFTFKKLALEIGSTEATIYRYFENKHRLLLYILNWYWCYMEYLLMYRLQNISDTKARLEIVLDLLTSELPEGSGHLDYNLHLLNHIVIAESSKVYLIKEVSEINKNEVFKAYKDLCAKIADIIHEYNPAYKYPRSLSTTLIECIHQQQFFCNNLPRLTDNLQQKISASKFTSAFARDLLFKVLQKP